MLVKDKIERINFLARKQKSEGLTSAEKSEQEKLRREYVDSVKSSLRSQLDTIKKQPATDGESTCNSSGCGCHNHKGHTHSSGCGCGHGHKHNH